MSEEELSRFGANVASLLGAGPSRATLLTQRARLIAAADELARRGSRPRRLWALAAVSAACAVAGVGAFRLLRPHALSAHYDGASFTAAAELAPSHQREALDFSDGSSVILDPETRAGISELTPERAELTLRGGHLTASIQKHTGITWTIGAGPYFVRVVGTHFGVDWDRERQVLRVDVSEGRVKVFGGDLSGTGVALDAGAHLERRYGPVAETASAANAAASGVAAPSAPATSESARAENDAAPAAELDGKDAAPDRGDAPAFAGSAAPSAASFLALARKGKYRQALDVAEKHGFDKLMLELPENDLLTLANAARYGGDTARARQALLKLRQRFPGRPAAELAALYLARIAEDSQHQPIEAAGWLRTFLQESPSGDLAEGARYSLLSILSRAKDVAGARAIAADYLRYHPSGPHAAQARALLGQNAGQGQGQGQGQSQSPAP